MSRIDNDEVADRQTAALNLILDKADIDECTKCECAFELGLVLGDSQFAVGVAVCPNCGHYGQEFIVDPHGKFGEEAKYEEMVDVAHTWVPDWHPGIEDIREDWGCACGKTWETREKARRHVYKVHPDKTTLSLKRHNRHPWDNLDADPIVDVDEGADE